MVEATRGSVWKGDCVVDERERSETERSGREWQDRYCSAALGTSQAIPEVMHNARLVRRWKRLAASDGSLVMQGASGECGIDAGESMIVVLFYWYRYVLRWDHARQARQDKMVRGWGRRRQWQQQYQDGGDGNNSRR